MQGFKDHVYEDHNMWNYLYFVLYLGTLYKNDRNAVENYVYKKVEKKVFEKVSEQSQLIVITLM